MPTYSYACTECDNRFDAVQAFTEDALTTCPQCSGRLRKLFNSVGVVFKGSGFYRTDSREGGKSATVAADSSSSEKAGSSASSTPAEKSSSSDTSSGSSASAGSSSSSAKSTSSTPATTAG